MEKKNGVRPAFLREKKNGVRPAFLRCFSIDYLSPDLDRCLSRDYSSSYTRAIN